MSRRPRHLIDKAQKIEAVCQRHGVELGAAAMQFPLFHPALCAVIPGALSVAEVKQNVARLSVKIPVELWSELKREKLLDPARRRRTESVASAASGRRLITKARMRPSMRARAESLRQRHRRPGRSPPPGATASRASISLRSGVPWQ